MSKTIKQLQDLMVDQLKRRGFYPKDEAEVLFRIGEEVGEMFEAVREKQNKESLSHEVVDVF
jgi:NTP pyrophosphatase (non-canonical NTP hydrolase)